MKEESGSSSSENLDSVNKKILFLGGAYAQIPIIEEARRRGFYVITCDYSPHNPGHLLANKYYNVSTTDFDGVMEVALREKVDYIFAYASDPAAPIAAFVAEKLKLPGNPYQSVKTLSEKDLFRKFLRENGFNAPKSFTLNLQDEFHTKINDLEFPVIVKPTDSSGSKGVSKVFEEAEIPKAIAYAMSFSRNNRLIFEEFIESNGCQLHGDGFVRNSELVFVYLGDHHYNIAINPFVPYSTTWPCDLDDERLSKVIFELQRAVRMSGYQNGPINIEVRINAKGEVYIMEIGPRSGGNFVPQVIQYATSFDMVKASMDVLEGKWEKKPVQAKGGAAYYVIHSERDGVLGGINLANDLKPYIKEFHQFRQKGEKVTSFQGSNAAIGVLVLHFESKIKMNCVMPDIGNLVDVDISEQEV